MRFCGLTFLLLLSREVGQPDTAKKPYLNPQSHPGKSLLPDVRILMAAKPLNLNPSSHVDIDECAGSAVYDSLFISFPFCALRSLPSLRRLTNDSLAGPKVCAPEPGANVVLDMSIFERAADCLIQIT